MQQALATRGRACGVTSVPRTSSTRPAVRSLVCRAAADKAAFIPPWRDVYNDLKSKGLRTVAPEEAAELLATGGCFESPWGDWACLMEQQQAQPLAIASFDIC
jgi:hypothetical protein